MMQLSSLNIVRSFKMLTGNAKTMMPVEPMFSISWALLQFYLGLYMKSQGLTAQQMGYLITIQSLSSIFFSLFGGYLVNRFGRKKTLLVTDLIAYPGAVLIWFFSDRFELFALAYFVHGLGVVVNVAWTCFLVEDINTEQRIAAYNFINGLGLCSGIFVPISGYVIGSLGLVTGQRTILGIAFFVMVARILLRNYFGTETGIGRKTLEENKRAGNRGRILSGFGFSALKVIVKNKSLLFAMCASVLLQLYGVTAAMNTSSLYYVTFLTDTLGISQSLVSVVGPVSSAFMLISFLFITPANIHKPIRNVILRNVSLVMIAILGIITLGRFAQVTVFLFVALYAIGYQGIQPMINTLVTDAAMGSDMPSVLSAQATITAIITAVSGSIVGYVYQRDPYWLYILSIGVLVLIIVATLASTNNKNKRSVNTYGNC